MNQLITTNSDKLAGYGRADQNPAAVYLASLSPGSRPVMRGALDVVAQIITGDDNATCSDIPWHELRYQHTAAIRAQLAARYAHSTANKILSALRGTLKAAWQLGLMSADDYFTAVSVKAVKGERLPPGRSLSQGEIAALLDTCQPTPAGVRDAAIIAILYACGLRRGELVNLDLADFDPNESRLKVRGKRNKERFVPIVNGARASLEDWLAVRGGTPGPLFTGLGNKQRGGRLTTQAIYAMLKRRADEAGIADFSPHDFRRTYIGDLLDLGVDIVTVQKLAGHASVETTGRYDRRPERVKQTAASKLHVPYRRLILANR
ncbi:MAG TPA: integrase [Anaerolineae bacterium]|nr:integrase [Anaerolineae bacterium]